MREFNEEEAKAMTHDEVMAVVCEGLSEVCVLLAAGSKTKGQKELLRQDARTFRAFERVFRASAGKGLDL